MPNSTKDTAFNEWLNFALDAEGRGFEDADGDNGGPTKAGITWIDYNEWRKQHSLTPITVEQARSTKLSGLTGDVINQIYRQKYWDKVRGSELPTATAEVVADFGLNAGISQAIKTMEKIVGLPADGTFDESLMFAVKLYISKHTEKAFVDAFQARRIAFYNEIGAPGKSNHKFLQGWLNRVSNLTALVNKHLI
jgi:lysozyme family protein